MKSTKQKKTSSVESIDYGKCDFFVSGRSSYSLQTALSLWKAKYPTFEDFKKDVISHNDLEDFGNFVEECWDNITPVTVKDALKLANAEDRRVYFDCIGVVKLFQQLEPELLDRQVIKKKRTKWDDNNDLIEYEFEDVYELYEIEGNKLFETDRMGRQAENLYAVRCWCTTTNREYWLYVDKSAALGREWWAGGAKPDAIQAIAWTIRVDVEEEYIERIYRQGDIIVVKISPDREKAFEKLSFQRHLSKESYLSLMYSET